MRALLTFVVVLSATACSPFLLPATPTEPIRATTGGVEVTIDRLLIGDDTLAKGVENEAAVGVEFTATNHGTTPYRLNLGRTSLWMAVDPRHPEDTHSWSPIGAGEGEAPDGLTVIPQMPTVTVAPGQSARVWVLFLGYRFEGSEIPRRVTLNVPGPAADTIRVTLADPALGTLRWRLPAQRSQTMIGFQNTTFVGGAFQGVAPATVFTRVSWVGPLLWDVGLVSGVAIQQKGSLRSSTSAFTTIGAFAHLTVPFVTRGAGRDLTRFGLYAGGGAAVWASVLTAAEAEAGTLPTTSSVYTVDGGLEFAFGSLSPAPTPFPLDPQPRPALPRWALRIGYTQAWLPGGTAGGLVTSFRLAF